MRQTREQMRTKLEVEANKVIEELLDWGEEKKAPSLNEVEEKVLGLRQHLGQEMAQVLLEGQEAKQLVEGPRCPCCGEAMRYKGQRVRVRFLADPACAMQRRGSLRPVHTARRGRYTLQPRQPRLQALSRRL